MRFPHVHIHRFACVSFSFAVGVSLGSGSMNTWQSIQYLLISTPMVIVTRVMMPAGLCFTIFILSLNCMLTYYQHPPCSDGQSFDR